MPISFFSCRTINRRTGAIGLKSTSTSGHALLLKRKRPVSSLAILFITIKTTTLINWLIMILHFSPSHLQAKWRMCLNNLMSARGGSAMSLEERSKSAEKKFMKFWKMYLLSAFEKRIPPGERRSRSFLKVFIR